MYKLITSIAISFALVACIVLLGQHTADVMDEAWTHRELGRISLEARKDMLENIDNLRKDIRKLEPEVEQLLIALVAQERQLTSHELSVADTVPVVKELPPFLQTASTTRILLWHYGQAKYNNSLSWQERQEIENNSDLAHPYLVLGLSEMGREAGIDMVYLPRIQHAQMCEAIFGAMGLQKRKRI